MESAIRTLLQFAPGFYYLIVKLVIQTWGVCMYVCMCETFYCVSDVTGLLFLQTNTPRRDGMADSPPFYCFLPADDGPNNFIARAIKLRGLVVKTREKCK
jgi:hypothetical protein